MVSHWIPFGYDENILCVSISLLSRYTQQLIEIRREYFRAKVLINVLPRLTMPGLITRRRFLTTGSQCLALTGLTACANTPISSQNSLQKTQALTGTEFDLAIGYSQVNFTGKKRYATTVNQSLPAPVLRWREGSSVKINVTNHLPQLTSIHWHGIILPSNMDGVPGLSFDGIAPGETFTYEFPILQSGTYWYHSHSNFQEQTGLYGAIIIDPATPETDQYNREYVILLSDWSDETPEAIYRNLKKSSHFYNRQERTIGDLVNDIQQDGLSKTLDNRAMWNDMRMSDRDISDVTGATYQFLINGKNNLDSWKGEFFAGEKIRLRIINTAAMTFFDFRIPDLPMQVIAADGQAVQPIEVDEFRIAPAETYDVIIQPEKNNYAIFAQAIDRSGFAFGKLICNPDKILNIPQMDPAPILTMEDMGHGGADHSQHEQHNEAKNSTENQSHSEHNHLTVTESKEKLAAAGFGNDENYLSKTHLTDTDHFGIDMRVHNPQSGINDPGIGLRHHQHLYNRRVLNYGDLKNRFKTLDKREPSREIQLRITGNMHRYIWSIDGLTYDQAPPIELRFNERIRITLINDTMMTHPFHLHGMWSELETGDPDYIPRKHTIIVQPGKRISYLVTADAEGRWAYHCHLLYHMLGMMREVRVVKGDTA